MQLSGGYCPIRFDRLRCGECPAAAALALILHSTDYAVIAPVDTIRRRDLAKRRACGTRRGALRTRNGLAQQTFTALRRCVEAGAALGNALGGRHFVTGVSGDSAGARSRTMKSETSCAEFIVIEIAELVDALLPRAAPIGVAVVFQYSLQSALKKLFAPSMLDRRGVALPEIVLELLERVVIAGLESGTHRSQGEEGKHKLQRSHRESFAKNEKWLRLYL